MDFYFFSFFFFNPKLKEDPWVSFSLCRLKMFLKSIKQCIKGSSKDQVSPIHSQVGCSEWQKRWMYKPPWLAANEAGVFG